MNQLKNLLKRAEPPILIVGISAVAIYAAWSLWNVGLLIFTR